MMNDVEHKMCSECEEWFPMNKENFYKNKSNKVDGFNPYCKQCTKDRAWKWQKDNWDKMLIHFKKENAKPEKKKRVKELVRIRRENGEYREWQRNNPDKVKKYNERRQQHKMHDISDFEWSMCKEYFNNSCAYCGMSEEESVEKYNNVLHKEHVDHEGSNDLSNCVPSCKSCNGSKWTHSLEDWYNETNPDFTEERLDRIHKWLKEDVFKAIES